MQAMDQIPPELVGRAIQDPEFRRRLLSDPETVARDDGWELSEDQVKALRDLDARAVEEAIEALLGDLATSKWG